MELKNIHVLVVDDMAIMRLANVGQLRSFGVTSIDTVNNGKEALDYIRSRRLKGLPLDLVLTDWNMPIMSGLDLLLAVRSDAKLAHLPLIMVTGESDREQIEQAIAAGVSELLLKPYLPQVLREKIVRVLLRARSLGDSATPSMLNDVPVSPVPAKRVTGSNRQPTILVVDDAVNNLRLMSELLADHYRVRIAHNGQKALKMCTSDEPPDLVLLDVMMPGMDGFEVAQRMREHPVSDEIPIIFVTALDDLKSRHRGLDLGAMDFVRKPVDPSELLLRVRNFMRYIVLHKQRQAHYDEMLNAARLRQDIDRMLLHDVKGPLAGVIGLTQQMLGGQRLSISQNDKLTMIEETVAQVLGTIDLSAEIFKIETGRYQLHPQPVPLGEMLHKVANLNRATFSSRKITLSVDTDTGGTDQPIAQGDPNLCFSAFHNLMKNACEAAPTGSKVSITLHDRTPLAVTIENQGTVPPGMRDLLFVKGATSKRGGSGLGTYSAKLLIEAQGGSITLETFDEDNRTVVSVTLPR
ncbi:ATP-binding response regulator [Pseudomonas sp. NPDC089569]|uniref:ATP-binding response regulator n=1 Tax=Pseudomonas sp. NPDC089569 TaxID=3390722 RepID=UPI003D03800C